MLGAIRAIWKERTGAGEGKMDCPAATRRVIVRSIRPATVPVCIEDDQDVDPAFTVKSSVRVAFGNTTAGSSGKPDSGVYVSVSVPLMSKA